MSDYLHGNQGMQRRSIRQPEELPSQSLLNQLFVADLFQLTTTMDFLEQLKQQYGPQVAQQLSSRYGIDPEKAADILPRMAPFVLGGVQSQMQHGEDVDSAHRVLNDHADESSLEDVDAHFERAHQAEVASNDTLAGLFGKNAPAAQAAMANQLGVSGDMIAKLLPVLAPLILGAVMNKMKSGASQENDQARSSGGGGGGMDILGSILGQVGGGSGSSGGGIGDILGSVLGGGGASAGGGGDLSKKAGCLSAILGGLLKGKR
jgi:hypothetical protein